MPSTASSETTGDSPVRRYHIGGHALAAPALAPGLYIVATPIGHLKDISIRALETLAGAATIYAEDTRVSRKLLDAYGIQTPLSPYHDHNAAQVRPQILARLARGEALALVSDAGTPLVSDPGFKLVRDAAAAGHHVTTVPGASAALSGLVLAGLPTDTFLFAGFLPPKSGARRARLEELARVPGTLIFFESGPRLAAMLTDAGAVLGDRPAAVAREITKAFEEVRRGALTGLATHYAEAGGPKGEIVVVIAPPSEAPPPEAGDVDALLRQALAAHSLKDAAAAVAEATGLPRREVYNRALALGREPAR